MHLEEETVALDEGRVKVETEHVIERVDVALVVELNQRVALHPHVAVREFELNRLTCTRPVASELPVSCVVRLSVGVYDCYAVCDQCADSELSAASACCMVPVQHRNLDGGVGGRVKQVMRRHSTDLRNDSRAAGSVDGQRVRVHAYSSNGPWPIGCMTDDDANQFEVHGRRRDP